MTPSNTYLQGLAKIAPNNMQAYNILVELCEVNHCLVDVVRSYWVDFNY